MEILLQQKEVQFKDEAFLFTDRLQEMNVNWCIFLLVLIPH